MNPCFDSRSKDPTSINRNIAPRIHLYADKQDKKGTLCFRITDRFIRFVLLKLKGDIGYNLLKATRIFVN